jgi:LysM repeat protein
LKKSTETPPSYLDVRSSGPPAWVLALGALVACLAFVAVFYGLYTINRDSSPTLTPDPLALTQAAEAETTSTPGTPPAPGTPLPGDATPLALAPTPTLSVTATATAPPPTYTVQQGDTLIGIAHRLNVDVDALAALNQISGETIYPGQVLQSPPTVTPWPETGPFPHVVSQGESLLTIAALYQVTVQEIQALNGLTSDAIFAGQQLLIPGSGTRPPTPTPTPEPWQPAVITGELEAIYSLTTIKGHFTLHIPPDTRAAAPSETDKVARLVEGALEHSQAVLGRRLGGRFDVYVAGTPFDAPYTPRRGYSLPAQGQLFLLYDGSGTPVERLYFTTYALAPLVLTRTLGAAASPLLAEGLAVHAGGQALAAASDRYLLPGEFCAAYQAAGRLPRVSRPLTFEGHLGHLDQYLAAGCFVGYLIETHGAEGFAELYLSGDYAAVYGRSLSRLESDWMAALREAAGALTFDPGELVEIAAQLDEAYAGLWADFEGTPGQFAVYERLDRARMALLQGRLGAAREHLKNTD